MIKPEELRLNNYFKIGDSIEYQVLSINQKTVVATHPYGSYYEFDVDKIEGIPLTPEWFSRFGIEKDLFDNYHFSQGSLSYEDGAYYYYIKYFCGDGVDDLCPMDYGIRMVHELQNVHYFLTGKELELKQ